MNQLAESEAQQELDLLMSDVTGLSKTINQLYRLALDVRERPQAIGLRAHYLSELALESGKPDKRTSRLAHQAASLSQQLSQMLQGLNQAKRSIRKLIQSSGR